MSIKAILVAGTSFDPQAFQIELDKIPTYNQFEVEQKHDGSMEFEGITQAELDAALVAALASPSAVPITQLAAKSAADKSISAINKAFEESFEMVIEGYPHEEVETWVYQADEADDIVNQKGNATPILDAIVAQTGEDITILAQSILDKEAMYKVAIGSLVGKRHMLSNQIAAISLDSPTAEADITAIKWL